MAWFVTAIISKEVKNNNCNPLCCRCFGFYNTYCEAASAVNENRGDMHECLYDYIVVEYMEPGIHPHVWGNQWFRWNVAMGRWEFTNKDDIPEHKLKNIVFGPSDIS